MRALVLPIAAFLVVVLAIGVACSSSSTGSSSGGGTSGSTAGACLPFHGDVVQGPNGAHCDSNGDCMAMTCQCKDGTSNTGQHFCNAGTCDGEGACVTYCQSRGGGAPCDAGTD